MKKMVGLLFHRVVIVGVSLFIQVALLVSMVLVFSDYFINFYFFCVAVSVAVVLWIVGNRSNPAYKIAWIVPILIFPAFGGLLYLLFGGHRLSSRTRKKMQGLNASAREAMSKKQGALDQLEALNRNAANQARYIQRASDCPVHSGTQTEYFPLGERKFERLMEELHNAEHYIFIEYFIIEEGKMWDSILTVLEEKAAQGVDVRVIYDDIGCMFTLPRDYAETLEARGIPCSVFNPFIPVLSSRLNNRDHRKILVIDGHTGFTGGINLADEYINAKVKYGHWKDMAVMLKGEGVWNLTVLFLSMWDYIRGLDEDFSQYLPIFQPDTKREDLGFVQPFTDSPLDDEPVGENVYLSLINKAERYVYITTPYLIIDSTMTAALCTAAKSGVDVRILTPHIPDKKMIFEVTRAHYPLLLEAGVRIFEYTPGFVHGKTFAVDDEYGVVGSINMDYRSLFLHFECGVWMYRCPCIADIRDDFLKTLEVSQEVGLDKATRLSWIKMLWRSILRIFAPLM
ncbi:MAG: cardiolipin synthase [Oscillospiraceae bacterium]|nr:cardiolipin synthase [Oscillospiraceae bacterium]